MIGDKPRILDTGDVSAVPFKDQVTHTLVYIKVYELLHTQGRSG